MTNSCYTRQEIVRVTAQFPNLYALGFNDLLDTDYTPLTDESIVGQVNSCARFIRHWCKPAKTFRRSISSYGWKHVAEDALDAYVCNGAFIAAAILDGYRVQRRSARSPNAVFNMCVPSAALRAYLHDKRMGRGSSDWKA